MQLECPKCGCKLSAFDREETEACPNCGLRFSTNQRPLVPIIPDSPELRNSQPFKVPGFIWLIHLVCPGAVTLLAALIGTGSNGFHALRLGILAGGAIALSTSFLIALGHQGWLARLGMTLLLFALSVLVNGFVLFGGCMLMIGISSHR